jgi:hypothetical protein
MTRQKRAAVCDDMPRSGMSSLLTRRAAACVHRSRAGRAAACVRRALAAAKSDLRNHQAIVQPRLYDCLMVTQITLKTEPHGFDSCQGHFTEKVAKALSDASSESLLT